MLPEPKLDEEQEEYSTVSLYSLSMICFPNTIRDVEKCDILAEANNPNFASAFKAQEKAINKKAEQLNETFKKSAEG